MRRLAMLVSALSMMLAACASSGAEGNEPEESVTSTTTTSVTTAPTTTSTTIPPTTTTTLPDAQDLLDAVNAATAASPGYRVSYRRTTTASDGTIESITRWDGGGVADGGDEPDSVFWASGSVIDLTSSPVRIEPYAYREVDHIAYTFQPSQWVVDEDHQHTGAFSDAIRGRLSMTGVTIDRDIVDGDTVFTLTGSHVAPDGSPESITLWVDPDDLSIRRLTIEDAREGDDASEPTSSVVAEFTPESEAVTVLTPPLGSRIGFAPGHAVPTLILIAADDGWTHVPTMDEVVTTNAAGIFGPLLIDAGFEIGNIILLHHDSGIDFASVEVCCPGDLRDLVGRFESELLDATQSLFISLPGATENLQGVRVYTSEYLLITTTEPISFDLLFYVGNDGQASVVGFYVVGEQAKASWEEMESLADFVLDTFTVLDPESHDAFVTQVYGG